MAFKNKVPLICKRLWKCVRVVTELISAESMAQDTVLPETRQNT